MDEGLQGLSSFSFIFLRDENTLFCGKEAYECDYIYHSCDHGRNVNYQRGTHLECRWGCVHNYIRRRDRLCGDYYLDSQAPV